MYRRKRPALHPQLILHAYHDIDLRTPLAGPMYCSSYAPTRCHSLHCRKRCAVHPVFDVHADHDIDGWTTVAGAMYCDADAHYPYTDAEWETEVWMAWEVRMGGGVCAWLVC